MLLNRRPTVQLVCALCFSGLSLVRASEMCVTVNDSEDRPLPNAWINVIELVAASADHDLAAKSYNKSADSNGSACFTLPEGTYSVEAGVMGFLNVRYYPVRLTYPNPLALLFRLPIGDVTEGGVVCGGGSKQHPHVRGQTC
jgi:hypothetical protein